MPRNYYTGEYYFNPHVDKPIEQIYHDMNVFSGEVFMNEPHMFNRGIDFMVGMPPVYFEGKFVRGFFISQGVDPLCRMIPDLTDYFIPIAFSMTSSYPWSNEAEGYLTSYDNPHRNAWFRENFPHRRDKYLIPLEDGDYLHEYDFCPSPLPEKDLDLCYVARLIDLKNLPFIAKVLKLYRQKYPKKKIKLNYITGLKFDHNFTELNDAERKEWRQVEEILTFPQDYINFYSQVYWHKALPLMYARSKVYLFGSLMEGKNRSMAEALCCNTPVLHHEEFNQYIRGNTPIVPPLSGMSAPYDPDSWADTLHLMLNNLDIFHPRAEFIKTRGRRNFLNIAIDHIDEYRNTLPHYEAGNHVNNPWLDAAIGYNYGMSLHNFLYGRRHPISQTRGVDCVKQAMDVYRRAINNAKQSASQSTLLKDNPLL